MVNLNPAHEIDNLKVLVDRSMNKSFQLALFLFFSI